MPEKVVRPALHQNEIGIIVCALEEATKHTPKSYAIYPAYFRVLRKLERHVVQGYKFEDHRRYVTWVKPEPAKVVDEAAKLAKEETERTKERLREEQYQRTKRINGFIDNHNDSVQRGY